MWKDLYIDEKSRSLCEEEEYKDRVKYDEDKCSINILRLDILKRFSSEFMWREKGTYVWNMSENIEYSRVIRKYRKILKASIFPPELIDLIFQYYLPIIEDGYEQLQYEKNMDRPFNEIEYIDSSEIEYNKTESSEEE